MKSTSLAISTRLAGLAVFIGLAFNAGAQEPACSPFAAGIRSWWPLEGNTTDVLGTNAGVTSGDPVFASGRVAKGMVFDGVDDSVRVPRSPSLDVGSGNGL